MEKPSRPKRELHSMPDFIREVLAAKKLTAACDIRPPYQRNDYIGWIARANFPKRNRSASPRCWKNWRKGTCTRRLNIERSGPDSGFAGEHVGCACAPDR
jgi:hypothetical protein